MPKLAHLLARWGSSALLISGLLASGPTGVLAGPAQAGDAAPGGLDSVLWDQTTAGDTGEGTVPSSKFEQLYDEFNSQAADDFENADGVPWEITAIRVLGVYEGGVGSSVVNSLLVQIYADDSGYPGTLLISRTVASGQIAGLNSGVFTVDISPSLIVGAGRYWLSVQAYKPDFLASFGRQWTWYEKEEQVLTASMWKQPGNGYNKIVPCLVFQPRVEYCDQPSNSSNYDLLFAVFGKTALDTSVPNPLPIVTSLVPGSRTPGGPNFTMVVRGVNFVSNSKVLWNSNTLTPTAWSGNRLTVTVPSSYIATAGTAQVKVRNPAPGGGDSNALTFHIGSRLFLAEIYKP